MLMPSSSDNRSGRTGGIGLQTTESSLAGPEGPPGSLFPGTGTTVFCPAEGGEVVTGFFPTCTVQPLKQTATNTTKTTNTFLFMESLPTEKLSGSLMVSKVHANENPIIAYDNHKKLLYQAPAALNAVQWKECGALVRFEDSGEGEGARSRQRTRESRLPLEAWALGHWHCHR